MLSTATGQFSCRKLGEWEQCFSKVFCCFLDEFGYLIPIYCLTSLLAQLLCLEELTLLKDDKQ